MSGPRSKGAILLSRTQASQDEIGAVAGASRVAASHWLNGTTKPNPERRQRIHSRWPAVVPQSWDEPWEGDAETPRTRTPIPRGLAGKRQYIENIIDDLLQSANSRKDITEAERATVAHKCTMTLKELARMPAGALSEHPDWAELEAAIARILKAHPEAAQAFEDEMARLESRIAS